MHKRDVIKVFEKTGTCKGDHIWAAGCRKLGISEDKIKEWTEGADFELDRELLPHYAKGPYANIYDTMEMLIMSTKENLPLLKIGKISPL